MIIDIILGLAFLINLILHLTTRKRVKILEDSELALRLDYNLDRADDAVASDPWESDWHPELDKTEESTEDSITESKAEAESEHQRYVGLVEPWGTGKI